MKTMTVVLDLTDIYDDTESGSTAAELLTEAVKWEVVRQLSKEAKEAIANQVHDYAVDFINSDEFKAKASERILNKLDSIQKIGRFSRKSESVEDLISARIIRLSEQFTRRNAVEARIDEAVKRLESQYDDRYAIGLIKRLKEANMLTEQGRNLLTESEK